MRTYEFMAGTHHDIRFEYSVATTHSVATAAVQLCIKVQLTFDPTGRSVKPNRWGHDQYA